MKTVLISLGTIVVLIAAYFLFYSYSMREITSPKYKATQTDGNIQIREYQPMLIAEVTVDGSKQTAISNGFKQLASFIFGDNISPEQQASKIAMTAPVMQQAPSNIAMTTPVSQQQAGDKQWKIQFVMPSKYTLKSLPKPTNKNIKLIEQPAKRFIVIRFSGNTSQANQQKHLKLLQDYIRNKNLSVTGEPVFAFYNPPWTLPFMRRNEVMFELQ